MAKQLVGSKIYNKDSERCEHFYQMGKSYNYNDCCIKFFIEKAINKGTNANFIGLSTGCMFCPECSEMDEEMLKVLCLITKSKDSVVEPYYTIFPEGITKML